MARYGNECKKRAVGRLAVVMATAAIDAMQQNAWSRDNGMASAEAGATAREHHGGGGEA